MTNGRPPRSVLQLQGELDIYHATELKETLLRKLQADPHLELNLSAISEIDTAGVQLLVWATRYAALRGGRLCLREPSQAVRGVIAALNLTPHLGSSD